MSVNMTAKSRFITPRAMITAGISSYTYDQVLNGLIPLQISGHTAGGEIGPTKDPRSAGQKLNPEGFHRKIRTR